MLRTHWMRSSAAAKAYYRSSDYYATSPGEWLGKGAFMLGLEGTTSTDQFDSLADNLDPRTGTPLTTYTRDGRRVGLDMTFNSTKSVGIARELAGPDNAGDPRIEQAHREAVKYTVGMVEKDMQARVRAGGKNENRTTGNLVAYRVTHRDTRISAEDQMPDMALHDHVFIFNATYDPDEKKWKAAEIGQIKHDAPFYEAMYHNRLASNLKGLGYGIRRKDKAFEINGITGELVRKFSRRRQYIEAVAEKLGISSAQGMAKLGATTRLGKADTIADDLNGYYVSRLTDDERQQLTELEGKPSYVSSDDVSVRYAIAHEFERSSVVEERRLYETALRHGIGSVTPEGVEAESRKQGVLLKNGEATTTGVLAEESHIIQFAREKKGVCGPMGCGPDSPPGNLARGYDQSGSRAHDSHALLNQRGPAAASDNDPATLSPEQQAVKRHVLTSSDQVVLIRGAAGTGKTTAMKAILADIDRPYAVLAPTAEASRGVLRRDAIEADTVAAFLKDEDWQSNVRNGVIWVDEAGLLAIRDLSRLTEIANQQNARIILQGDPKQHKSVARHGNMFNVLQEYAGLPVAELKEIRRQRGEYKEAVKAIDTGDVMKGHDILSGLGYVERVGDNTPLVDEYLTALEKKESAIIVAPTHREGDEITAELRERLKEKKVLGKDEQITQLVALNWTDAQKGDVSAYDGTEILQFHRNAGPFKAGQRIKVTQWEAGRGLPIPSSFSVYRQSRTDLAAGDVIRITAPGKDVTGRHRLDNGSRYTVTGFDKKGNISLSNGWTLARDFGHLTHGYVSTSHSSQGKTVDRVFISMGSESLGAINAEQFYVSVSRGRKGARIYTDMPDEEIRGAIQRSDTRKSATQLMTPDIKHIFYRQTIGDVSTLARTVK